MSETPHLYLVGEPGSGRSSYLRRVTLGEWGEEKSEKAAKLLEEAHTSDGALFSYERRANVAPNKVDIRMHICPPGGLPPPDTHRAMFVVFMFDPHRTHWEFIVRVAGLVEHMEAIFKAGYSLAVAVTKSDIITYRVNINIILNAIRRFQCLMWEISSKSCAGFDNPLEWVSPVERQLVAENEVVTVDTLIQVLQDMRGRYGSSTPVQLDWNGAGGLVQAVRHDPAGGRRDGKNPGGAIILSGLNP